MPKKIPTHFQKTTLAIAASMALFPSLATSIELVQAPPGTIQPYVTPNVIISVDDSGSMDYCLTLQNNNREGASNCIIGWDNNGKPNKWANVSNSTEPNADGTWPGNSKRINVLKYSLKQVFSDTTLLPDKKIRLAWQSMWNNGNSPGVGPKNNIKWSNGSTYTSNGGANNVNSSSLGINSMQSLQGNTTTSGTHRKNFLEFVNKLEALNGTPSHLMFSQADGYMRRSVSQNGPWSGNPGGVDTASTTYLGCRRNYHIMMTDGRWNGTATGESRDNNAVNKALPDSTVYGSSNISSRPKNSLYSDNYSNTLADWAFYSWSEPLQSTGLTGKPQPSADYDNAPAIENFGKDSKNQNADLERYWNPKYNPANWPHMVTYTIGFSSLAVTWPGSPEIIAPTNKVPFGYDGSFPDFATGNKKWPELDGEDKRSLDLWHAALNGRGRFYAVEKGEDLEKAFREIFGQINTQTDPDMTSTATSGSNNTRYDVGKFTGNYEPKNGWKGFITAETVKTDGTTVSTPGWKGQNTAEKLDTLNPAGSASKIDDRFILSWSDKWENNNKYKGGVSFQWATDDSKLSSTQKIWLQKKADGSGTDEGATVGKNRLNFIRGDRSLEGSESSGYPTSKPFRERKSIQGDIINSIIWFTGIPSSNYPLKGYADFTRSKNSRLPMIYAGGNDGMLHGFSANDGTEKIAYVPQGIIPSLSRLTDPTYNKKHRNFVDGSPMTGDIYTGANIATDTNPSSFWKTFLVGSLGSGGKGYFVLDVTTPDSFATSEASSLVKLDRTRSTDSAMGAGTPNCALTGMTDKEKAVCTKAVQEDRDIGNITATPVADENNSMRTTQITRMNNNRWAAVMGNGYNSTTQRPVLLIQYLDNEMELKRVPTVGAIDASLADIGTGTGIANDNGLAAPRLIDINGDGMPDIAYAGDNQGNMWKFDLSSPDASNWGVAFNGQPLFTAQGPASLNSARTIAQSITAPPTVRANDRKMTVGTGNDKKLLAIGGMMVAFGTGRNATKADENNRNVQTIYSVIDNTRYNLINTTLGPRVQMNGGSSNCSTTSVTCIPTPKALGTGVTSAKLAQQTITEINNGQFGTIGAIDNDNKLTADTWPNYNGWYLDLPAVGERQLKPMEFYDGSNILAIYSQVPAKGTDVDPNIESCESTTVDGERQYRTFINIMDGLRPSVQIVDKNKDGIYNSLDSNVSRSQVSKGSHTLITQKNHINDIDTKNEKEILGRMPEQSLRPSWRQLR